MRTPTSATASKARPARARHGGFTLLELLVVFGIAAVLMVIVPIAYGPLRESSAYRETLRNILTDLRGARQRAQAEGREVRFVMDLPNRTYGIEGRPPRQVPEMLQLRATVATIEMGPGDVASVRFLPSGGATGGAVDVMRPSGAGARLNVDWFSGQVSQSPLQE